MFANKLRISRRDCNNIARSAQNVFKNNKIFLPTRHLGTTGSSYSNKSGTAADARNNSREDIDKRRHSIWMRLNEHNNNRALSTLQANTLPKIKNYTGVSKDESRDFMSIFPDIVRDLTEAGRHLDIPEVIKHYAKVLQYNVPNGKKSRGLAVVAAYKYFEKPEKLTPENVRLANIMGWCVEMLQAHFLILDDIVDNSETRRGIPCWYRRPNIGLNAMNDAILVEKGLFSILRQYFGNSPAYVPAIELFHDITMKTAMGQSLDASCLKDGRPNFDAFTMKRYESIVKYKSAYYSFQLPVALAMYMSNNFDEELHRQAKTILLEMGHFFQVQDDFLDCFGDPNVTGKVGSDIYDGKCSWLAVVALQRATPEQRTVMEKYYGKPEVEAMNTIKGLYEELGLPNTYAIYEEETNNLIRTHIQQISKGLPHELFFKLMEKLYRRSA